MSVTSATAAIDAPCLPGELLDAILDCLTFDNDAENALAALRSCILVSRAFRLRAMYILVAHLEFSPSYGSEHAAKSHQLFELLRESAELRALPRSMSLDWSDCEGPSVLLARALDMLPTLPSVKHLTLSNLDACDMPMPRWEAALTSIEHLTLDECSMSTADLDGVLTFFPNLRKLELLNTHVSSVLSAAVSSTDLTITAADDEVTPLPFVGCAMSLVLPDPITSVEILHWSLTHRASFVLHELTIAPFAVSAALRDAFFAVFGQDVTALSLGLAESQFTADDEVATLNACKTATKKLTVLTPSIPRALLLFRSVRLSPPPLVNSLAIRVGTDEPLCEDDLKALRDALSAWTGLKHVLVDKTPLSLEGEDEDDAGKPAPADEKAVNPYAPPFALGVSSAAAETEQVEDDEELNTLLVGPSVDEDDDFCDDETETVGAPTPNLVHPPAPYRSTSADEEDDSDIEEVVRAPTPYAPPFALGVSTARASSDDESDMEDTPSMTHSELSSDSEDLDTPHDSDVELELDDADATPQKPTRRRNPYAPPFALGVSCVARPDEEDDGVRFDAYKPPFPLGVSTARPADEVVEN
ncbi:hypothetical protein EXIGLDRAFT_88967 [Exidia glandulosa HHB12029]|uniref:Uncharacterized protein n=1 Tax=Exidia glandulosa HHB12029 TaxID=1314781 RepID=A0A166BHZ3_EXIGL|nr:hypothetical protein EXIGLDRAFT_88967 [Exidia glandulosa HHB12029]